MVQGAKYLEADWSKTSGLLLLLSVSVHVLGYSGHNLLEIAFCISIYSFLKPS